MREEQWTKKWSLWEQQVLGGEGGRNRGYRRTREWRRVGKEKKEVPVGKKY